MTKTNISQRIILFHLYLLETVILQACQKRWNVMILMEQLEFRQTYQKLQEEEFARSVL